MTLNAILSRTTYLPGKMIKRLEKRRVDKGVLSSIHQRKLQCLTRLAKHLCIKPIFSILTGRCRQILTFLQCGHLVDPQTQKGGKANNHKASDNVPKAQI